MEVDPGLLDVERQIGLLAANDIRYVVIHKQALPPQPPVDAGVLAGWRALFGPEVDYEDDEIAVYRTRLAPGQGTEPILRLGEDLGLTEVRARRTWTVRPTGVAGLATQGALTVDLTWTALADLQATGPAQLCLPAGAAGGGRPLVAASDAGTDLAALPHGALAGGRRRRRPLRAAHRSRRCRRAPTVLQIDVAGRRDTGIAARRAIRSSWRARPQPLVPALAEMQHAAGVTYGGEMRLLGYDLARGGRAAAGRSVLAGAERPSRTSTRSLCTSCARATARWSPSTTACRATGPTRPRCGAGARCLSSVSHWTCPKADARPVPPGGRRLFGRDGAAGGGGRRRPALARRSGTELGIRGVGMWGIGRLMRYESLTP